MEHQLLLRTADADLVQDCLQICKVVCHHWAVQQTADADLLLHLLPHHADVVQLLRSFAPVQDCLTISKVACHLSAVQPIADVEHLLQLRLLVQHPLLIHAEQLQRLAAVADCLIASKVACHLSVAAADAVAQQHQSDSAAAVEHQLQHLA